MVSLGVVYMLAVVIVSVTWGVWLGVATSLLSALAYNYFHLPPVGHLTISNGENWVALIAFVIVSMLASSVAEVTRARSREAAERRREADLAAEMARLLLGGRRLSEDLPTASARLSQVLGLPSAAIELEAVEGDERRVAFPLREGPRRLGTLLVPADTPEATLAPSAGARRAGAGVAAERRPGARLAAGRRGRDGRAAAHRCGQDRSSAGRLPRSAFAADGDLRGSRRGRLAVALRGGASRDGRADPAGDAAPLAPGRQPARPLAPGSGSSRAARGAHVGRRGDPRRARGALACARGLQPLDRSRPTARERRSCAAGARVRERAGERAPALGGPSGVGQGARGAQPRCRRRGVPGGAWSRTRSARARRSTPVSLRWKAQAAARPATGWWFVSWIAVQAYPRRSWSACSNPSTAPARRREDIAAPAWGSRSPAASPSPTAAGCMSSRSQGREQRSCSSCRSHRNSRRTSSMVLSRSRRAPSTRVDCTRQAGADTADPRRRRRAADPARAARRAARRGL